MMKTITKNEVFTDDKPPPQSKLDSVNHEKRHSIFRTIITPKIPDSIRLSRIMSKTEDESLRELIKTFDKNDDGVYSSEEVFQIIKGLSNAQKSERKLGMFLSISVIFILMLSAANIGSTLVAVNLSKEIRITSDTNEFVSAKSGERIGVLGQGFFLNIEMTQSQVASGERDFCIPTKDWAKLWFAAESGSNVGIRATDSDDIDKEEGINLSWHGSTQSGSSVCFPTDKDGSKACIDYEDNKCTSENSEGRRKLMMSPEGNEDLSRFRKNLFKTHLEAFRNGKSFSDIAFQQKNTNSRFLSTENNIRSLRNCDQHCLEDRLVSGTYYTDPAEVFDVVIVGAGWAGLSAASVLKTKDPTLKVKILEANDYVGGRSHTEYFDNGKVPVDLGSAWITYFEGSQEEQLYELLLDVQDKCEVTENVGTYGLTELKEHNKHRFFFGEGLVHDDIEGELVNLWSGNGGFESYSWKRRGKLGKGENESYQKVFDDFVKEKSLDSDEIWFLESETDSEIATFYGADLKDVFIKDAPLMDEENMLHMGGSYSELAKAFAKCKAMSSNIYENISLNSKVTKIDYSAKADKNSIVYYQVKSNVKKNTSPSVCEDVKGTFSVGKETRQCAWAKQEDTYERCKTLTVSENCPVTCHSCCEDVKGYFRVNDEMKQCKWAKQKNTNQRCQISNVLVNCPLTCNSCCRDVKGYFSIDGEMKQCKWVQQKNTKQRCQMSGVSENCPVTCNSCDERSPRNEQNTSPSTSTKPSLSPSGAITELPSIMSVARSQEQYTFPSTSPIVEPSDAPINIPHSTESSYSSREPEVKAIYAKKVILTVSLGVLKDESIIFKPRLPKWKTDVINEMKFGVLNKCIMYWKEWKDVPWSKYNDEVWYSLIDNSSNVMFKQFFNEYKTNGSHQILTAFLGGNDAIAMEYKDDSVIKDEAMLSLQSMFPNVRIPEPNEYKVTRWLNNENFKGAYTVPTSNMGTHSDTLGKSIRGKLYFAGEATTSDWYGSTSGAFLTGKRVANEVLE